MCRKSKTNAAMLRTFILPFVFRAPSSPMSVSKRRSPVCRGSLLPARNPAKSWALYANRCIRSILVIVGLIMLSLLAAYVFLHTKQEIDDIETSEDNEKYALV